MPEKGNVHGTPLHTTVKIACRTRWEIGYGNSGFSEMDFFSTLPYGWIPHDTPELIRLFLDHLKQMWLESCSTFHTIISNTVCSLHPFIF